MSEQSSSGGDGGVETLVQQVVENLTNGTNGTNDTERFKATSEGLFLAYSSLVLMALIPVVVGSFKSVKHQKSQKVTKKK